MGFFFSLCKHFKHFGNNNSKLVNEDQKIGTGSDVAEIKRGCTQLTVLVEGLVFVKSSLEVSKVLSCFNLNSNHGKPGVGHNGFSVVTEGLQPEKID